LGNAPLVTTLNFAPNIGTVFTMIQNGSAGPISGTFNGLAEGATVTINGLAFRISYVGGDGNDVTLTRVDSVGECSPRPQVRLQSAPDGPGRLKVTVTAGTVGVASNRLQEIHFRPGTNAVVDINGQTGLAGDVLVPLPAQPTSVTLLVRKVTPGQASQLPFTVVDSCGAWQTFVGGGPSAF